MACHEPLRVTLLSLVLAACSAKEPSRLTSAPPPANPTERDTIAHGIEVHSLADVVRGYWVTSRGDGVYVVDAAVPLFVLPHCFPRDVSYEWGRTFATLIPACDDALRAAIGLAPDETITAWQRKPDAYELEFTREKARRKLRYEVRRETRNTPGEPLASHPEILARALSLPTLPPPVFTNAESVTPKQGERAALDAALADKATRWPRCTPSLKDGVAVGLKCYAVETGSPLANLGLENGDTITAIDGTPITSPEAALALYKQTSGSHQFAVSLVRRGQPLTLTVAVVAR